MEQMTTEEFEDVRKRAEASGDKDVTALLVEIDRMRTENEYLRRRLDRMREASVSARKECSERLHSLSSRCEYDYICPVKHS